MLYLDLVYLVNDIFSNDIIKDEFFKERMLKYYHKDDLKTKISKCRSFSLSLARKWIRDTLPLFQNITNNEKIKSVFLKIFQLKNNCKVEYEHLIYSFFLYFSGILYLIKDDKEKLKELKDYFDEIFPKTKDRNIKHFFRFINVYIDILNPEVESIEVFEELKNCLEDDKYNGNIIFSTLEKEQILMNDILKNTMDDERAKFRRRLVKKIFSGISDPDIHSSSYPDDHINNIIQSFAASSLARLYLIAGDICKHNLKLKYAIKLFSDNPFALVQQGNLLLNPKYQRKLVNCYKIKKLTNDDKDKKVTSDDRNYDLAIIQFSEVLNLIDQQFNKNSDLVYYKLKIESKLGLGYIDYLKGRGKQAEEKYTEAVKAINEYLELKNNDIDTDTNNSSKDYLYSVIQINRSRNILDNEIKIGKTSPESFFDDVIEIYKNAKKDIKDELSEIVSRAYNNKGVYFLNEGRDDEAENQFKQALDIDKENSHARYNLGILHYRKNETDRAVRLFKSAINLDPNFFEAKKALEKLGEKRKSLGMEWFEWWFERLLKNRESETRRKSRGLKPTTKLITAFVLFFILSTSLGWLAYTVYLHDIVNMLATNIISIVNKTSSTNENLTNTDEMSIPHEHNIDENAFLIVFLITIVILMLPFIRKLSVSGIEIEVESAGYRPIVTSLTSGSNIVDYNTKQNLLFYPRFWY